MLADNVTSSVVDEVKQHGLWLIIFGILQIIIGFFALTSPLYAGLGVAIAVGIIFLFSGIFELFNALKAPSVGWGVFRCCGGVLAILIGIVLLIKPLIGLSSLTLVLAFFFLFDGIDRIVQGFKLKGVEGRGWIIFGGAAAVILAILILVQWPLSNVWAVGVLAGIHITFAGWSKIMIGASARSLAR